jgi:hypothetical protein
MVANPYAWHLDHPRRRVPRAAPVAEVVEHLRRGAAVKVIGGRGMGKQGTGTRRVAAGNMGRELIASTEARP